MNKYPPNNKSIKNKRVKNMVKKNIKYIINTLSTLTNSDNNYSLTKITLNLVLVNEFSKKWLWTFTKYNQKITWFLHFIINELNDYGLEFCKPIISDKILFEKLKLDSTKLNTNVGKFITNSEKYQLVESYVQDFEKLIKKYIQQSKHMTDINGLIKLSWKGEEKSIEDIYTNINSSISNPTSLLALYDILYKFSIATIFYYTTKLHLNYEYSHSKIHNLIQIYFVEDNFPITFKEFINEYKIQIYNNNITENSNNVLTELCTKLNMLGIIVYILLDSPNSKINNQNTSTGIEDNIKSINNLVAQVNHGFGRLKHMFIPLVDEK